MKFSSKKNSGTANASAHNHAENPIAAAARKPMYIGGVTPKIDDLSLEINDHDFAQDAISPSEDEVTLAEILAGGNMPDETFTLGYDSDNEAPPPNDDDYVKFHAIDSATESIITGEDVDFDENFNLNFPAAPNDTEDLTFRQTPLAPLKKASRRSLAAATSTTLAQEHREALTPHLPPKPAEDAPLKIQHGVRPLPPPAAGSKAETVLLLMEEISTTPSSNTLKVVGGSLAQPDIFQNANEKAAGANCMFCNHTIGQNAKTCRNCGAPVKPKRLLHDWVHIYSEHGTVNPNLVTCRFCGHMVYRRAHVCPRCQNILLKPVYTDTESIMASQTTLSKPLKLQPRWFQYIALIALALAIAALIINKALTQTP